MLTLSLLQASSDLSTLDFDVPYSLTFAATTVIEILTIIGIMASVTWQVLIVAVPASITTVYIQVYQFSGLSFC